MYLEFENIDLGPKSKDTFECNYLFSGNTPGYDIKLAKDNFLYEHSHPNSRGSLYTGDGGALEFSNAVVKNVEKARSFQCHAGDLTCNLYDILVEIEPFSLKNGKNCLHVDLGVEERLFTDTGGCDGALKCEELESYRVINKGGKGNDLSKLKLSFNFNEDNFANPYHHSDRGTGEVNIQLMKTR